MALAGSGFDPRLTLAAIPDLPAALPEGVRKNATLEALPGKKPLIKLSYRPPNYETPLEYFRTAITPHDAFFVRYHLSHMPDVDVKTWKIVVGGEGANGRAEFTLDDLKRLPAIELVAVNQCSGNRRGLFQPHVPGVQWSYGAMGGRCPSVTRLHCHAYAAGGATSVPSMVRRGRQRGPGPISPNGAPTRQPPRQVRKDNKL
jgi:hypothetical protein